MSAPQLISPLLDGFVMGDAISNHDGVRSCPAVHLETDKKYIIKIISVPASQSKLDALLLAGAFSDRASAEEYFKELAEDVLHETEVLQNLSKHEGFVSFENLQMIPMQEGETGFDIYLLGLYRNTLDGVLRNNEMTQLQAINLGLDLCAALSAARRLGYIYSNLKPSNIFLCNEREFRIGDLGFLSLDSLQFASLPDKYRSEYTPAEISDAYAALNSTMDTYALGLILYQAYNNGKLPTGGQVTEAPIHADPALAEIILKACAADPAERWEDPVQMGQALVNYMQSNPVNDVPIVPVTEEEPETQEIFPDEDTQPSTDDILTEVDQALEAAPDLIAPPVAEEVAEEIEEPEDAAEPVEEAPEESAEEPIEESEAEPVVEELEEAPVEEPEEAAVEEAEEVADTCEAEEAAEDAPVDDVDTDETAEDATQEDETAEILAQADELIAHQLPDPPVAPEPFEVTLPEKEEAEPQPEEEAEAEKDSTEEPVEESEPVEETEADEEPDVEEEAYEESQDETPKPKNKRKGLIITAIILAAILVLGSVGVLFYQFFYLQTIEAIQLLPNEDQLTVQLTTDIPDEKLTVKCTDTHGNALTATVENGVAYFSGLRFGTAYTVEVRINGFHKLIGETTKDFTTTAQTVIDGFYAITGTEDGSVVLSFTPQGPSSDQWTVTYVASGEEERTVTFTGPVVTLTGLTVGKEYTFTLSPVKNIHITGTNTITYTASNVLYAQNLRIPGYENGNLTVAWDAPEGASVSQWHVRCYNDAGFDKTVTVEDTFAIIEGIDLSAEYKIDVTADGMCVRAQINLNADSILITNVTASPVDGTSLNVTWDFSGSAPAEGWLLIYTVDGYVAETIACNGNSAVITPLIPGATYSIRIKPANNTLYFGGNLEYDAPEASAFSGYSVTAEDMEFSMCKTPSKKDWDYKDVSSKNYTTSFKTGVSASFVMHVTKKTSQKQDVVTTLYVIRDADSKVVSANTESRTWDDMWDNRYGELTIPEMPETPGDYTVEIYFDGEAVTTQSFKILAD